MRVTCTVYDGATQTGSSFDGSIAKASEAAALQMRDLYGTEVTHVLTSGARAELAQGRWLVTGIGERFLLVRDLEVPWPGQVRWHLRREAR